MKAVEIIGKVLHLHVSDVMPFVDAAMVVHSGMQVVAAPQYQNNKKGFQCESPPCSLQLLPSIRRAELCQAWTLQRLPNYT